MKLKNVIILLMASLSFWSCKTDTFADYVDAENEAIDKYFKDINAVIVHEKPETVSGEWLDSNNRKIFYTRLLASTITRCRWVIQRLQNLKFQLLHISVIQPKI